MLENIIALLPSVHLLFIIGTTTTTTTTIAAAEKAAPLQARLLPLRVTQALHHLGP